MISKEIHEELAKSCFNSTWQFIEKDNRSDSDVLKMMNFAHASRYHWGEAGSALEFQRGEWLLAKVYSILGYGEVALLHAKECVSICEENSIGDFDICFAYEAMANAYKLLGDTEKMNLFKQKAIDNLDQIEDKGNYDYTKSEIDKI